MNTAKIVENLFFGVTCVSVLTCIVRSDYNFAMGLLGYYMIKNVGNKIDSEVSKTCRTVSTKVTGMALLLTIFGDLKICWHLRMWEVGVVPIY